MKQTNSLQRIWAIVAIVVLVGFDQITKFLAAASLKGKEPVILLSGVFELHYLENQSAAFGVDPVSIFQRIFQVSYFVDHPDAFLTCKMFFFVLLTIAVAAILIWIYLRIPADAHFFAFRATLVLFLAGAIGNFIDRVWHNYVIDFFYFKLIDFPIFNVADIYVTSAAVLLIILGFFYYKEEDFELIFPKRKTKDTL